MRTMVPCREISENVGEEGREEGVGGYLVLVSLAALGDVDVAREGVVDVDLRG